MEKKEYLIKLIGDYVDIITYVERLRGKKQIHKYLEEKYADCGVCKYANRNGIVDLYSDEWVKSYVKIHDYGGMWAVRPRELNKKKDILESLKVRLVNLEEELSIS